MLISGQPVVKHKGHPPFHLLTTDWQKKSIAIFPQLGTDNLAIPNSDGSSMNNERPNSDPKTFWHPLCSVSEMTSVKPDTYDDWVSLSQWKT